MITGRGRYVDDMVVHGMLYMAVVRSTFAHARITGDRHVEAAKAFPGVHGVFTGEDLDDIAGAAADGVGPAGRRDQDPRALAAGARRGQLRRPGRRDRRRRGQVRRRRRRRAGDRRVRRRCRSSSTPRRRSQEGSPLVHEDLGTNQVHEWTIGGGDMDAAWAEADVVHRAADRQPPHRRHADRAARVHRRLPRGPAHAAPDEPEPAPDPAVHGRRVRDVRGLDPGDRAGRRRRLRREDHALPGGDHGHAGRPARSGARSSGPRRARST